ncbi:hypothetical protein N7448_003267 [Penicillium atrosanguineum]|uniref:Uncharacterized protein n=1 Tax=Penicillium atrosanguineum TaxID=1132637 RepID=A0A9W9PX83_9EURO|nr:Actin-regulating kinase PRK1 [Penicillium atrosanguineum]KAJ5122136.1 hypothetical protein N7526_009073 [Penicillium atrosanguineum]KAJ5139859.1 hypothetical protein N7448_003267 [Penicillium atrosanguineum]KAJ5309778.1 Actin-regulating kinase PRK1 [Penicillium atrosanguineum]KAJ5315298.1 hypothetical protein N7476_005605 [Penicillium atrosanguineum]
MEEKDGNLEAEYDPITGDGFYVISDNLTHDGHSLDEGIPEYELRSWLLSAPLTSKITTDPPRSNYRPQPLDRNVNTGSRLRYTTPGYCGPGHG